MPASPFCLTIARPARCSPKASSAVLKAEEKARVALELLEKEREELGRLRAELRGRQAAVDVKELGASANPPPAGEDAVRCARVGRGHVRGGRGRGGAMLVHAP